MKQSKHMNDGLSGYIGISQLSLFNAKVGIFPRVFISLGLLVFIVWIPTSFISTLIPYLPLK